MIESLTGNKYGRLTVVDFSHTNKYRISHWKCRCSCGNKSVVKRCNLISGSTKSCGCFQKEQITTHGMKKTKVYKVWDSMRQRCNNSNSQVYKHYGARGIKVCKHWDKFENFYKDMGEPNGKILDRTDNNKGYSKNNCRWVDFIVQNRNRRNNRIVTHQGKTMCLSAWAEKLRIPIALLCNRLNKNWSIKDAFNKKRRINQYA